jgi:carbon-monoxide dehydrogenase medium subunit
MPPFRYHRPAGTAEALDLLAQYGSEAKPLAGGQSLLPLMALRLSRPAHLLDIGGVAELAALDRSDGGGLSIGAATRHSAVEMSPVVVREAPLLAAAMPYIGHRAIRNRGTIGGSLAHADPAAELPAVALSAGAEVVARRAGGERTIPAEALFAGYLTTVLDDDELLTAVRFPAWPPRTGWSVQEVARRHGDFALVGLAAVLGIDAQGRIDRAALSFFGVAATPVRVADAEALLIGQEPGPAAFAEAADAAGKLLDPPDDLHATAAYRSHTAGVLVRRALTEAAGRIEAAA